MRLEAQFRLIRKEKSARASDAMLMADLALAAAASRPINQPRPV